MQPQVSVIVPIYNVEPFFEKCLHSLFGQTLEDIEYLFVNDCTPDGCMSLLESILKRYPQRKEQVHVIHHEQNRGLGASRKDGMKAATGKYVIHCDSDDWVELTMYERLYRKAIEEDADIVYCGFYVEYKNKQLIRIPEQGEDKVLMQKRKWDVLYSSHCNKLVRRSLFVNWYIYPYEGIDMWEDLGVITRLRFLSRKTVIIYEPLYHYNRLNNNSLSITQAKARSTFEEQSKCARELESFFRSHDAYETYFLLIQNIKFESKQALLRNGDYQEWLGIFPETHPYVWKFDSPSLSHRFKCFLAIHKIFLLHKIRRWINDKYKER
ncbi:MAG: glycosyltransferase [Tannerellaceae bacterium]|jgi:glycosyltransferase involved in cell wall biosynthesis|nr:glycosyltransferase [Tannerellaceae bacterium]